MKDLSESRAVIDAYGSKFPFSNCVQHAAWHVWMVEQEFDYFVTLTFPKRKDGLPSSLSYVDIEMIELAKRINKKVYGHRRYKHSENEVVIFYFPEQNTSGEWHVHALVRHPQGQVRNSLEYFPVLLVGTWRFLTGSMVNRVDKIHNQEDADRVSSYCLKDTYFDKGMVRNTKKPS
jgi:hypothetical protein